MTPKREVGTHVTTSGYPGTITRVCEWPGEDGAHCIETA